MNVKSLTDEDKKKLTEYMNYVAEHATFTHKTDGIIAYFKLLAYLQQTLLPKIDANILEVIKVVEPEKKLAKNKATPRKK